MSLPSLPSVLRRSAMAGAYSSSPLAIPTLPNPFLTASDESSSRVVPAVSHFTQRGVSRSCCDVSHRTTADDPRVRRRPRRLDVPPVVQRVLRSCALRPPRPPYIDIDEQDPELLTRPCRLQDGLVIDLWVFRERAAMLVAVGILELLVASHIVRSLQRPLLGILPTVALVTITAILADRPGSETRSPTSTTSGGKGGSA
jgi:hypothetical protein